jgi:hypothetical protein
LLNPKFSQIWFAITGVRLFYVCADPRTVPARFSGWRRVAWAGWLLALLLVALPGRAFAQEDPCGPGNLIWNCRFDSFTGSPPRQVPAGWTPFVVSGDLTFMQDSDTYFGPPSLRMWSNSGTFTAGILTQVTDVQPGATYAASWGWGGPNDPDSFGRKLGIDPTGGTDPLSPNVVWGPLHYGPGRFLNYPGPHSQDNPNVSVAAAAQSSTITVFVWVEHPRSTGDNLIYIDQVGLRLDSSAPPAAPATATPAPATATPALTRAPTRAAATAMATQTFTATPTDLPTATASSTPTDTPTPTVTPTDTPTPTATPSPTLTPTASPTLAARPTATPQPIYVELSRASQRQPSLLLFSGFGSLAVAAIAALLIWRVARRE